MAACPFHDNSPRPPAPRAFAKECALRIVRENPWRANVDKDSPKHLVDQTLSGRTAIRAVSGPLAVHYCAGLAGVSMRDYTLNPRALADSVIRYHETFHPDAIWLSADTWVTAQAMGAAVAFPTGNQPMAGTGEPCVRTARDIDRIPCAGSRLAGPLANHAGSDAPLPHCRWARRRSSSPASTSTRSHLYAQLMGIERVMTLLVDDLPLVQALDGAFRRVLDGLCPGPRRGRGRHAQRR